MSKKPPKVFQAPFEIFDMFVGYHRVYFDAKIGIFATACVCMLIPLFLKNIVSR